MNCKEAAGQMWLLAAILILICGISNVSCVDNICEGDAQCEKIHDRLCHIVCTDDPTYHQTSNTGVIDVEKSVCICTGTETKQVPWSYARKWLLHFETITYDCFAGLGAATTDADFKTTFFEKDGSVQCMKPIKKSNKEIGNVANSPITGAEIRKKEEDCRVKCLQGVSVLRATRFEVTPLLPKPKKASGSKSSSSGGSDSSATQGSSGSSDSSATQGSGVSLDHPDMNFQYLCKCYNVDAAAQTVERTKWIEKYCKEQLPKKKAQAQNQLEKVSGAKQNIMQSAGMMKLLENAPILKVLLEKLPFLKKYWQV